MSLPLPPTPPSPSARLVPPAAPVVVVVLGRLTAERRQVDQEHRAKGIRAAQVRGNWRSTLLVVAVDQEMLITHLKTQALVVQVDLVEVELLVQMLLLEQEEMEMYHP